MAHAHLLIMQPAAAWAIGKFGAGIGNPARFFLVLGIAAPSAYLAAFVTYRFMEVPGQSLGKIILKHSMGSRARAKQTRAEEIAAP